MLERFTGLLSIMFLQNFNWIDGGFDNDDNCYGVTIKSRLEREKWIQIWAEEHYQQLRITTKSIDNYQ